jgi:nucleotide-binding universal stress UspA family protein
MTTITALPEAGPGETPDLLNALGPILVASDGTASSDAAVKAALQLARHSDTTVAVLTVLEPLPLVSADFGLVLPPTDTDQTRRSALFEAVKTQMNRIAGTPTGWTIELRDGDPAAVIARTARETRARVIVTGLGHHDLLDRLFGGETALHTLRVSRIPVFAVAPAYDHLPRRAIVATDFSLASVRAARAGLALFDSLSLVYLVHVAPRLELQPEAFAAWMSLYGEGVGPAFERVRAELGLAPQVTVETITRQGKPSREVLDFARSAAVDLIITGSRGAGLIDRILVGSTATGIIRGAQCSVLAVPAPTGAERPVEARARDRTVIPTDKWADELKAFTRRNAGRRASLEVDDPELGAQAQEHDYPLLGVAYDHHDRRVEIMLGDLVGVQRHLTRGITDVSEIDIVPDEHGRDWILRVAHGRGQTILTLRR